MECLPASGLFGFYGASVLGIGKTYKIIDALCLGELSVNAAGKQS